MSNYYHTTVEIGEVEKNVTVHYDTSPPEPDVNWAGGVDIESVIDENGVCIMDQLPSDQIDYFITEISERGSDDYYARGDYEYDQKKDREAEERYRG